MDKPNPGSNRYMLAHILEPVGQDPFSKWPLHITLAPWFDLDPSRFSEEKLVDDLSSFFQTYSQTVNIEGGIDVRVSKQIMFGPKLPVMLVEPTEKLKSLHQAVIKKLKSLGIELKDDLYCLNKYKPHITVRGDRSIQAGTKLNLSQVSLVRAISTKPQQRQKVADIKIGV